MQARTVWRSASIDLPAPCPRAGSMDLGELARYWDQRAASRLRAARPDSGFPQRHLSSGAPKAPRSTALLRITQFARSGALKRAVVSPPDELERGPHVVEGAGAAAVRCLHAAVSLRSRGGTSCKQAAFCGR